MTEPELLKQINAIALRLGRLPTVSEVADEIARDRTIIHAALRDLRRAVDLADQRSRSALAEQVQALVDLVTGQSKLIEKSESRISQAEKLLDQAATASRNQRAEVVSLRIALSILAHAVPMREVETEANAMIKAIRTSRFALAKRELHDGDQRPALSAVERAKDLVQLVAAITPFIALTVTGGVKPGHQTGAYGRPWRSKTRPAPYLFV